MPDITRYTAEERRRLREQALRNSKQNNTTGRKTIPAPVVTSPVVANKKIYTSPVKQSAPGMPPAVRSTPDIYRREIDKKFISDMMNNSSNRISNFTTSLPGETSGLVSDGNVNVPYNRAALSSERNQLAANLSTITRMQAQYAETDDQEMKDLLANAYGLQMDLNDLLNSHGEYIDQFDTPQQQAAFEYDQEIKNTPDVIPFDQWRETFEGFENDKRTSDPTTAWQYDQQLNTLIDYAMAQPSLREPVMEYLRTESDAYDDASRAANAAEREIEGMWASPRESLDEAAMNIHSQMENYYNLADEEERARLAAEEAAPDLSRAENQLYYNELNDQYGFSEIEERNAKLENGGVHEKAYEAFKSAAAVDFGRADGNGQQSVLYYADPVEVATYLSLIPPEERAKGNYVNTSPFSNKGWEAAEAYLTYIRDRLEQRAVTEASDKMRQYYDFAASDNGWEKLGKGIAGTAASVAGGILQGVHAADIYGQAFQRALTGSKEPIHFYSTAMPNEYASVPREAITSELDGLGDINSLASKVFGKDVDIKGWGKLGLDSVYNAAVDSLTSLANVGLFGRSGMGAAMGLQAAAPAMNEAHEAGANDWQSVLYGTGIGAAEGIGEQVGFERFLQLGQKHGLFNSTKGKLLLGLVLQPFNEGVGEAATEQIGQLVDRYVLDENSDYQRRIQTYISQGIAPEEAEARVDQEMGEQIVDSMLQGILGGAMTSGGYYAADAVNKAVTGKKSARVPVETASKPPVEGTSEATKAKAEARLAAMKTTEGEASLVDNAPVTVAGITKTGADATVTVTDESGADRQVRLEEVTVGKGTQGEVYAYAADMATPELANTFRMVYRPDQDISQVANGMEYVYEMAEGGAPETFLRKTSLTSALNDDQFKHAYDLGKKRRVETIKAADEKATARLQSVLGNQWKGGTLSMGDVVEASLTEKQREDVELVRVLAGISGYKVELFQSTANEAGRYTRENGSFNRATNTISLDVNAGRDYVGDSMAKTALLRTMSHEVTHAIKANSPAIYGRLQEAVLEVLSTQGIDIDERISAVMTRDSSVKSRADALEEIVSDACETMLGDSDVAQRFKEAHPEEARSLGEKILEFLKNLRDAIKKAFAGEAGAKSVEAKALLKNMDAFQKIAEIWTEGALQTSEVVGRENGPAMQQETETAVNDTVEETVGQFDEPAQPAEAHIDQRDWENVADDNVRAFQNDYKFARNWMGLAARALRYDVDATLPGMRFMNAEGEWNGQKRQTTDLLAYLKDEGKWTWDQIGAALDKIASFYENGDLETDMPNSRRIKRIELVLDDMLSNGYTTMDGIEIAPDRGWLEYKKELPGAKAQAIPENAVYGAYEVRFSIRELEDGTKYTAISARDIGTNATTDADSIAKRTRLFMRERFRGIVLPVGRTKKAYIRSEAINEYTNPAATISTEAYNSKMLAATELDNLLKASEFIRWNPDDGRHKDAVRGWNTWRTRFAVYNSEIEDISVFEGEVKIKRIARGDVFYDITKIKNITNGIMGQSIKKDAQSISDKSIVTRPASEVNPEIKKSTRAQTDTEEFKRWFKGSKIINADGSPKVMYHGTPYGEFFEFKDWQYFTENREYADVYQTPSASSIRGRYDPATNPTTYEVYLKVKKPFDTRLPSVRKIWNEEFYRKWGTGTPLMESGLPDWTDGMDIAEFIEENDYDFDAIILDEGATGGYGDEVKSRGYSVVVRNSNQIKSATDNVGSFDPDNPDIRYSARSKSDPDTEGLLRIHNEYREAQNDLAESKRKLNELADHPKYLALIDEILNQKVSRFSPEGRAKTREIRQKTKAIEDELGITTLSAKVQELEERVRDLYRQEQDFETNLAQKREAAAIEKSGLSEADYFRKMAVKEFGYTADFVDAGYLLPNGKMLNFSGEKGKHFGVRGQDHRAIGVVFEGTTGSAALARFMNGGNIRIMAESPGIDIAADAEPTTQQYAKIRAFVREYANKRFFNVDISDAQGIVLGSYTYNGAVNADRVVNDIKFYYENGSFREQSQLSDFLYSTRDPYEVSDREILANALEDATKNADEKAWLEAYKKDLAELNATQAILDENRSIISSLEYRKYQKKETLTKEETDRLEKARVRVKALVKRLAERDSALLKVEAAPQIKAVLERQREKYEERRKNAVAHVRQTQENAAFRKRIARKVKRLDELVRKPTDQKHVPDELRGSIIQLVKVFAEDTGVFQKSILRDVRDQYELLAKGESGAAGLYDEDTKERLEDLEKLMDGKRLSELSREALREVDLLIDHMSFLIDNANTIFVNGRRETIDGIASEIVDQTLSKGAMMTNKLKNSALWKLISSGQITPVYFFKHIGGGFQRLGESILAGESKFGVNALKARDKIQGLMNQYHYHEWSNKKGDELTLKTEAGAELKLSREQALALYATYKRETSNELQNASHLRTGGVILPKDSKKLDWFKKSADVRNGAPITAADMSKVQNWLTKEQMDYADAMVDYLSKDLSRMGNETSVAMHGYSKFGEGYYYPYKTSANFRRTNLETAEQALIKNMGFTKSVVRKATAPVELYDFTTTVAEHVNNMLLYTSFAEAQDVFMRVYDHKVDENHTVKSMLETSFGSNTKNYIEQFMKDIYGGVTSDKREGLPNKLLSAFKRNAVMGSLSVAIQQPTSFARAFALVDPKHFAVPGIKGGFDEAMKYAGTAVIKDMGRFDTTGGRSVAEWLAEDSYQGAGEKAKAYFTDAEYRADINGFLPEVLDKVTWSGIWKAVKHEQAQKTGLDIESEALKEIAGRRFDEVIRRTQVYDSVMAKSEIMRSKSFGLKMVTAFMAEPTVTYNMGVDAVIEAKKGNKKVAARLLSSLVVASVLNNLAKSLITAARDDNEDEPIVEKYLRAVFGGLLNDVNPVNYVPFLKDIWSIYQGYDVARTDMNIVTDLLTAATEEVKLAASGNATFWDYAKPAAAVFSMLTAVPIKNWWRDTEGIVETISGKRGKFEAREGSIKRIAKESGKEFLSGVFYDFWSDSKKNNARKLLGAAISGDERAIDELNEYMQTFNGMDESQIETSLTNALKGRFEDGGVTEKDALRIMMDYAGYTKHDAEAKIAKWKYDVDTDNEFSDMQDDFIEGKITESDAISAMVEYGGKTEREAKAAVEKWKYQVDTGDKFSDVEDMFVRGDMTKAEAEAALTEYGGYRKSEAADKVQQWQYEIDTGRKYSEMKDDYLDGTIRTNKEAADFRVKYGGQDPDSAEATVMQWQYDKDTGRVYSEMRYDFADGIISRSQAEGYLQKYGLKEPDEAYWAVEGWKYESDGESEWSGKFTHLHDAMADNDTANIDKAITQVYENSAYKDEDAAASAVVSAITSQYKPLYIAASEAERERLETLLLYAYRRVYELADKPWYGDYRRLKTIRKWLETDD